ncbi:MAG: hypothetical protein ACON5H_07775 [Akkermansiaceae bacterium]
MTRYLFLLFGVGIGHMLGEKKGRDDQPVITFPAPKEEEASHWKDLNSPHTVLTTPPKF